MRSIADHSHALVKHDHIALDDPRPKRRYAAGIAPHLGANGLPGNTGAENLALMVNRHGS